MSVMMYSLIFMGVSLFGFAIVAFLMHTIRSVPVDHAKASRIADVIRQGAMTFLYEEYKIIFGVAVLAGIVLSFALQNLLAPVLFGFGALTSMTAGFIGMRAATLANVRTTLAAKNK